MSTVSRKRKLNGDEEKFYAVRAGKTPGVYKTWAECQENTTGFKGASYKSFTSEQEASDFVTGKSKSSANKASKYYGVAVGHVPGVYTDWDEAKQQVTNIKLPKYKKFETRREAEEFVRSAGKSVAASGEDGKRKRSSEGGEEPVGKKVKVEEDMEMKKVKVAPVASVVKKGKGTGKILQVYTDGSSRGNGKVGAVAGVGVWFGEGDERNLSEPLEGPRQTNQRAELTGILRALQIVSKGQSMEIITDSSYSINCCTVWVHGWQKNGWKTSTGKVVENKDLVEVIKELLDERQAMGVITTLTWIKGHDNNPGNEAADLLAVAGAQASR